MLQYHRKNAESTVLAQNLLHRINAIEHRLMERLENSLIEALSEEKNGTERSYVINIDYVSNFIFFSCCIASLIALNRIWHCIVDFNLSHACLIASPIALYRIICDEYCKCNFTLQRMLNCLHFGLHLNCLA